MINRWSADLDSRRSMDDGHTLRLSTRSPDDVVALFIEHFTQRSGPAFWTRVYVDNDAGVGDGVTREAFTLFWNVAIGRLFHTQGGDVALPSLSPIYNAQVWEIIGQILAFTVAVIGQFPIQCIPEVMCLAILGLSPDGDEELLIHDLLSTLAEGQRTLLEPLFQLGQRELTAYMNSRRQALLDILREF